MLGILSSRYTDAPAVPSGFISVSATLSPGTLNLTSAGYDDWIMDTGTSFATFHRKGTFGGAATGIITMNTVNLTAPGWGHGGGGSSLTTTAGDCVDNNTALTSDPIGHDQSAAGDAKLQFVFPAAATTRHAYIWFQPDGTDFMTIRFTLSDASYAEQVLTVPSGGSETPRLYTATYNSAGSGTFTASLETGAGLSTHSYFLFEVAAYQSS